MHWIWVPVGPRRGLKTKCDRGGIGRRAGFRFQWVTPWGFESPRSHEAGGTPSGLFVLFAVSWGELVRRERLHDEVDRGLDECRVVVEVDLSL